MAADSESRKQTLDALQRRFAVAKTELLLQEKKTKNTIDNEDGKKPISQLSTSNASSSHLHPPSSHTSKKGNFSFSGRATFQDFEEGGPAYAQLSLNVNPNLLMTSGEFSAERESSIDSTLHEILQKGNSAPKYMQGSRNMKIDNWILLDSYVPLYQDVHFLLVLKPGLCKFTQNAQRNTCL